MNLKHTIIKPKCAKSLVNAESALPGEAEFVLNLRERDNALVAVGNPEKLFDLPAGASLLIADERVEGTNFLISSGKSVVKYAFLRRNGDMQICNVPICSLPSPARSAVAVGDYVAITTDSGLCWLYYDSGNYDNLDWDGAMSRLAFSAVEIENVEQVIPDYSFKTSYSQWEAPLSDTDANAVKSLLGQAFKNLTLVERSRGRFTQPVAVRYAVRLKDGCYVWVSAPVVVGVGVQGVEHTRLHVATSGSQFIGTEQGSFAMKSYAPAITVIAAHDRRWDSLIGSIEVFVCEADSPIVEGQSQYRCEIVTRPERDYYLSASLPHLDSGRIAERLVNTPEWKRIAVITDFEALRGGTISGLGWHKSIDTSGGVLASCTWAVENLECDDYSVKSSFFASIVASRNVDRVPTCITSDSGRLYLGGGLKIMTPQWGGEASVCGEFSDAEMEIATMVYVRQGAEEKVVSRKCVLPVSTFSMGSLIAVDVPNAVKIKIIASIGGGKYVFDAPLKFSAFGDFSYYVDASLSQISFQDNDDTDNIGAVSEIERVVIRCPTEMSASVHLNPLVFLDTKQVGDGDIVAIVAPDTPVTTNIFGRFPLYAFSASGIYAVNTDKSSVESRCVSSLGVNDGNYICKSREGVYFYSGKNIYRLSGAKTKLFVGDTDVVALKYVERFGELWVINDDGESIVFDSERRCHHRTVALSGFSARELATTSDGSIVDLSQESFVAGQQVEYRSHPFALPLAPRIVQWHCHNHEGYMNIVLYGVEKTSLAENLLYEMLLAAPSGYPIKQRLFAPGHTTLRLAITGTVSTSAMILPVTFWF